MKVLYFIWNKTEECIAVVLFTLMILFGTLQVISRFGIIPIALDWTEELSRYVFIALVYISASLAIAHRRHVRVEIIDNFIHGKKRLFLDFFVNISWCLFNLLIAYEGYLVAEEAFGTTTPVLEYDMGVIYLIIPITFTLMALRVLVNIGQDFSKITKQKETDNLE